MGEGAAGRSLHRCAAWHRVVPLLALLVIAGGVTPQALAKPAAAAHTA
jgi:hypothetical protein